MHVSPSPATMDSLSQAQREFERWRQTRPRGERIPDALWRTATDLAQSHGVSKTSQALHLDYYAVQRRLAESEAQPSVPAAEFVEVSLPVTPRASHCQLEICDHGGGRMRVDVSGLSAKDLAVFVRTVAGQEP